MKIIRTFSSLCDRIAFSNTAQLKKDEIISFDKSEILVYPSVNPLLAQRFFGFDAEYKGHIEVAAKSVATSMWNFFDGGEWKESVELVFQSVTEFRKGMEKWHGGIQFIVKLFPHSRIKEISFGYEVNFEITEYLLNYAIPDFFRIPCNITYITRTNPTGRITLPTGYELNQITAVSVQQMGMAAVEVQIVGKEVITATPILDKMVQVTFSTIPFVHFTRGLYQLEKLPCVIVRELPIRDIIMPFRMDTIETASGEIERDYPVVAFDLPVEVLVMAQNMVDAKLIARSLMGHIRDRGKIHIPPIDMDIGVYLKEVGESNGLDFEGGMGVDEAKGIIGGVATATFKMALKNLDY